MNKSHEEYVLIRPTANALLIRGWLYLGFCLLFQAVSFYLWWMDRTFLYLVLGIALLIGALLPLFFITIKIELLGDKLIYSYLFGVRKILRLIEIGEAFRFKEPDNTMFPTTKYAFTTKIIYVLVPADRKPKLIQIDSSLFSPEKVRALDFFLGEKIGPVMTYDDAFKRILEIRRA